jgi:anti-sigma B factor antagonist
MEIKITSHAIRIIQISPLGRLSLAEAPSFGEMCRSQVDMGGLHFVLDMRDITYIDSAGLSELVNVLKYTRQHGGEVRLILPLDPAVLAIFKLIRFDLVFTIISPDEIIPKGI